VIPCELLEDNADKLRALVLQLAQTWGLASEFSTWVESDCVWLSSLVDRIVPGKDTVRFFEMNLKRVGDTTWPAAGAVSPK